MARRRCKFFTAAALAKGAKVEKREHHLPIAMATKIARDHLCENPSYYAPKGKLGRFGGSNPEWRIRKRPIGGWWAEFLPPGRKRWIPMLGVPFRSREAAEAAVREHKSRLFR